MGTVHGDPGGYRRLSRLLEEAQPGIITVEVSPYALSFRKRESASRRAMLRHMLKMIAGEEQTSLRDLIAHPAVQGIFILLREPYEWRAAAAYAAGGENIILKAIDLSRYSREKLAHVSELTGVDNLRSLLRGPAADLHEQSKAGYRRAEALFRHPPAGWAASAETINREAHMARTVRGLVRNSGGRKVLHIGGWEHLLDYPGGDALYGRLKDLRPERRLLNEVRGPTSEER